MRAQQQQYVLAEHGATRTDEDLRGTQVESLSSIIRKAICSTAEANMSTGQLSAKGTKEKEDPIHIVLTYDGANLTEDDSGVRLALTVRARCAAPMIE